MGLGVSSLSRGQGSSFCPSYGHGHCSGPSHSLYIYNSGSA